MPPGVRIERAVPYADREEGPLDADLFLPDDESSPAAVYVHGGGWRAGERDQFAPQAERLAHDGVGGMTVAYRLSGTATYPAAASDVATAVRWLRDHADRYGVDPDRVALVGASAGAHLAALVGVAPRRFGLDHPVAAVAAFNGVYDLTTPGMREVREVVEFLGDDYRTAPDRYAEASPMEHVDPGTPPTLLFHGTDDEVVPREQATAYRDRLRAARVRADLFTAEGANHGFFADSPWYEPTIRRLASFFEESL